MAASEDELTLRTALEVEPLEVDNLKGSLVNMFDADEYKKAQDMVKKAVGKFVDAGRLDEACRMYALAAEHELDGAAMKLEYRKKLLDLYETDREQQIFIEASGFTEKSKRIKAKDGFVRLACLRGLTPGAMVFDRTWGFGVVDMMLLTEERVQVDFTRRPGHLMALSYAAESLDIIGEDHLYVRQHKDPEGMAELVKKSPDEVIKILLRSFGPKPAPIIQEIIERDFVAEGGWKRFWDNGRKKLKADPLIIFPAKRSECIELLDSEVAYDDVWFDRLAKNTDMTQILAAVEECLGADEKPEITEERRAVFCSRLAFTVKGAEGTQQELMVRALLFAKQLGLGVSDVHAAEYLDKLFTPKEFVKLLGVLSARSMKDFLAYIQAEEPERTTALYVETLNVVDYSALTEIVSLLLAGEQEATVSQTFKEHWNTWTLSVAGLLWLNNNMDWFETWAIGKQIDLVFRNLSEIQNDYAGHKLRSRNQLRDMFTKRPWLKMMMEQMDERQQRSMTQGVKDSSAWTKLDKASVLGKIVKLHPEMQSVVSERVDEDASGARRAKVSSQRSFRERELALRKIILEEIPNNSQEIATAREYGDLRENFEFKAARDAQRLLLQRQADLEAGLASVTMSTFEGFATDKAGLATSVSIRYPEGREETYHILGMWDTDEERGVISNETRLARKLDGKVVGDKVFMHHDDGDLECVVTKVEGIPQWLRDWIVSDPEADVAEG